LLSTSLVLLISVTNSTENNLLLPKSLLGKDDKNVTPPYRSNSEASSILYWHIIRSNPLNLHELAYAFNQDLQIYHITSNKVPANRIE
jgi:hypothetical protein